MTGTADVVDGAAGPIPPATPDTIRIARNAGLAAALGIAGWAVSRDPAVLDRPVTLFVNAHLSGHPALDVVAFNLANAYTLTGSVFMAAIWYCWFASPNEARGRLIAGTIASFAAATFSRGLQHLLPGHVRPLHDPTLPFHLSPMVDPSVLNGWASFPSDHAAAWFGLATTILIARRRLGLAALVLAGLAAAARNLLGYHYPTDLISGAGLGVLVVWAVQVPALQHIVSARVGRTEHPSPTFYAIAFLASFQIGTLCDGLRRLATGLAGVFHLPTL